MSLAKISCDCIHEGVIFSAPVFFDDGINMFLAANHPAKFYHVMAIKRWNVPYLLTSGTIQDGVTPSISQDEEELEELSESLSELEELEELPMEEV